jgi:hypothetical protein
MSTWRHEANSDALGCFPKRGIFRRETLVSYVSGDEPLFIYERKP